MILKIIKLLDLEEEIILIIYNILELTVPGGLNQFNFSFIFPARADIEHQRSINLYFCHSSTSIQDEVGVTT